MHRFSFAILALSATLVAAGAAMAQAYPPYAYPAPTNPYYYPQYAPPPPPAVTYTPGPYDGTHTGGGAGRGYWGPKAI